jgi:hypothetical protein
VGQFRDPAARAATKKLNTTTISRPQDRKDLFKMGSVDLEHWLEELA